MLQDDVKLHCKDGSIKRLAKKVRKGSRSRQDEWTEFLGEVFDCGQKTSARPGSVWRMFERKMAI
ncbi:MAG TPA: hypothetical protein VMC09_04635 [Anaerolineales bacterium]|nr:hypothetical protein [Anaerolineales bacterium]